jgi:hypothetical protein
MVAALVRLDADGIRRMGLGCRKLDSDAERWMIRSELGPGRVSLGTFRIVWYRDGRLFSDVDVAGRLKTSVTAGGGAAGVNGAGIIGLGKSILFLLELLVEIEWESFAYALSISTRPRRLLSNGLLMHDIKPKSMHETILRWQ